MQPLCGTGVTSLIDVTSMPVFWIDRTAVSPVPMALVVRRAGREHETSMSGAELREIVEALYAMFGVLVRGDRMAAVRSLLDRFPQPQENVALVPPWEKPE